MSAQAAQRVGRFYTSARRHPWVLGKVGDFRIWLGPYNPAQIAVAVLGALLLITTVSWWTALGPFPLVAWVLAIWALRRPRIAGRSPMAAIGGYLMLLSKPPAGQIGGRPARDKKPTPLLGGFVIEQLTAHPAPHPHRRTTPTASSPSKPRHRGSSRPERPRPQRAARPAASHGRRRAAPAAAPAVPLSSVQQLIAAAAVLEEGRQP
ncbi:hypothetical protein P8605_02565 [Streptomyces sp. T-3]|nr:hypothetical protein [Streptomyces sp. T-3]